MNWDVAIYETFSRLETRWLVNTRLDLDPDFYDYNAWPMADFMASVEMVGQFVPQGRFLDVGCGTGTRSTSFAPVSFSLSAPMPSWWQTCVTWSPSTPTWSTCTDRPRATSRRRPSSVTS